jgi:hypothetical protein
VPEETLLSGIADAAPAVNVNPANKTSMSIIVKALRGDILIVIFRLLFEGVIQVDHPID